MTDSSQPEKEEDALLAATARRNAHSLFAFQVSIVTTSVVIYDICTKYGCVWMFVYFCAAILTVDMCCALMEYTFKHEKLAHASAYVLFLLICLLNLLMICFRNYSSITVHTHSDDIIYLGDL